MKQKNAVRWDDVITIVAARTGLSLKLTKEVLTELVDVIFENVALDARVYIGGLGTFYKTKSQKRKVVLPDGTTGYFGGHELLKFKAVRSAHSKILKKKEE